MKDIIVDIFAGKEYQKIHEEDNCQLFKPIDDEKRHEFWLVFFTDNLEILETQGELFGKIYDIVKDRYFEKNTSLLILHTHSGNVDVRNQISEIEEDGYFFKKYVISYFPEELDEFKNKINSYGAIISPLNFIKNNIILKSNFQKYKTESFSSKSWLRLLYKLAIKIPIINIEVPKAEALESLFEKNDTVLQSLGLLAIKDCILTTFDSLDNIKDMEDDQFLTLIEKTYAKPQDQ